MGPEKRPLSSTDHGITNNYVVIISDDEEPPRKRQKSITPASKSLHIHKPKSSEPLIRPTTPTTSHRHKTSSINKQVTSEKKPSPWKNRPSWIVSSSPPTVTDDDKNAQGSKNWTSFDDSRLRGLSLSQDNRAILKSWSTAKPQHYTGITAIDDDDDSYTVRESEELVNQFKFNPTKSLKFNPSGVAPTSNPPIRVTQGSSLPKQPTKIPATTQYRPPLGHVSSGTQSVDSKSGNEIKVHLPQKSVAKPLSVAHVSKKTDLPTPKQTSLFQPLPRPHQPPILSINVPLSDTAKFKRERKELQEKLKQGVDYAKAHPVEVERLLGLTGLSKEFPANLEEDKFRNATQPKKRVVDRTKVILSLDQTAHPIPSVKKVEAVSFVHPQDQAKAILTARFSEHFKPPLTFCNTVNDRRLNGKFQFISEYIFRRGVKVTGHLGQPGCSCKTQCENACSCLRKAFKEKSKHEWFETVPQYERRPGGPVVLRDDFIRRYTIGDDTSDDESVNQTAKQRVEITECNDSCPCDASCINRVVQKGRTVPLEIFETNRCGFGVRSSKDLVRGQFIELYLGEVITEADLVCREEAAEAGSTSYIYSLDWFSPQQAYHVDGENFGSAMRFVNHSCDPNSGTFTVLNDRSTKQLHHVAFFAIKDIPAGTEITIDYTPQAAGTTYELNAADEDMEKCYCGAKNCRQMLWLPGKERKARKRLVGKSIY